MKRVVIDAGHGYNTPGKRIPSAGYVPDIYKGAREWVLNSRVAKYLESILVRYDVEFVRSDDHTGSTDTSLSKRKQAATGADMFISIHHNAGLGGRKGGGVVVYSRKQQKGETRQFKMGQEARKLYDAVVAHNDNKGNRAMPVAQSNFTVLYGNPAPIALLIECGFMDGPDDIPLITSDDYARRTAEGIAYYIIRTLDLQAGESAPAKAKTYLVKMGDSLWKIAKEQLGDGQRYKEIAELNGISPGATKQYPIHPGQTLVLPD